jgi:epoxyqueuosine reductase
LVIVATPQPHGRLTFHPDDQPRSFIVPSNYSHAADELVRGVLAGVVEKAGFGIRRAQLPLKLLAVRSGLARYGKNNIAYIGGMGSFFRPIAFYTDFPFEEDNWSEKTMADRCLNCTACVKKCPTGAIDPDRFQIRAEQCLTYFNEEEGDMPAGIDPSIHHCLIGCLYCQKFCPLNQEFDEYIEESSVFSNVETEQILSAESNDSVTPEILAKLDKPGLHYDIKIVARNMRLLMANNILRRVIPKNLLFQIGLNLFNNKL